MCHLVLLLPVFGLVLFWVLPLPVAAVLYAIIFMISIWLYSIIMRAMSLPVTTGSEGLIGQVGEIIDVSDRTGQLMVHGEVWRAISQTHLHKGQEVRVVGVDRLALEVEDATCTARSQGSDCGMHHKGLYGFMKKWRNNR